MAATPPWPILRCLLLLLLLVAFPSHPRATAAAVPPAPLSSSPFDAALAKLQARIGYAFRAPDLLRRAMTHASYSRENGRALAVLGLAAAQSAAALAALAADNDAAPSAVSRRASEAASEAACAAAGAQVRITAIVRVASRTNASAAPVVCGALRALIAAVAIQAMLQQPVMVAPLRVPPGAAAAEELLGDAVVDGGGGAHAVAAAPWRRPFRTDWYNKSARHRACATGGCGCRSVSRGSSSQRGRARREVQAWCR